MAMLTAAVEAGKNRRERIVSGSGRWLASACDGGRHSEDERAGERPVTNVTAAPITLAAAATRAAERFGAARAILHEDGGEWRERSFAEVGDQVTRLAGGLLARGVEAGDRVAILASTRPEWTLASLAISAAGGIVVPLYATSSAGELAWALESSGARALFCDGGETLAQAGELRAGQPSLEHLIAFEDAPAAAALGMAELGELGADVDPAELEARSGGVGPEDPYTIIYTSGTTGRSKGVVLSHGNVASICAVVGDLGFVGGNDVSLLHLPLAHVFALTVQVVSFEFGATIGYYSGDLQRIAADLAAVRPTYFPSVPRLFEKVYALAAAGLGEDREHLAEMVEVGLRVRELTGRGDGVDEADCRDFEAAEARLFGNVRALFGGRLRDAVTGAAPIAPEIVRFFHACGVPLLEGWGMTETTGLGTVSTRDAFKIGRVGKPIAGLELRLAEDGEILVRGPNVFREYWRNPEATREAFTPDGWLRTGDLGGLDEDGYLSITGRKKELIVTSTGKKVAPAAVENELRGSPWLEEVLVFGERRSFLVALLVPDWEKLEEWARRRGLGGRRAELAAAASVRELLQGEVDTANSRLARHERVRRFAVLAEDLSPQRGELTPTLKVRRAVVEERRRELIGSLYEERASASAAGRKVRR
jgi:long-chain acyl-CoA synthetase